MMVALGQASLAADGQPYVDVRFRDIKAARVLEPAHEAQLLNFLRGSRCEVGLLLNFGPRPQCKRLVLSQSA